MASSAYMVGSAVSYFITPIVIRGPIQTYHSTAFPADWANKKFNDRFVSDYSRIIIIHPKMSENA